MATRDEMELQGTRVCPEKKEMTESKGTWERQAKKGPKGQKDHKAPRVTLDTAERKGIRVLPEEMEHRGKVRWKTA